MIEDRDNSNDNSGRTPEDDLFKNFSTNPMDNNKPSTNSIALTTMLAPNDDGFISTDQLDAAFNNASNSQKEEAPPRSGLSAPKKMALKSNQTSGTPEPAEEQTAASSSGNGIENRHDRPAPAISMAPEPRKETTPAAPSGLAIQPEKKSIKIVGSISTDNASVGQILQEARVCLELGLTQVEQQTKIKRSFLEAVERDDLKNLPAMCYVSAYIKTLCQLYRIDNETSAALLASLKEKKGERTVPNELLQSLENDKHINFEEEAKLKKFAMIAIVLIIVIAGGIFIYNSWTPDEKGYEDLRTQSTGLPPGAQTNSSIYFNEKELEMFIPNIDIDMSTLPIEE